MISKFELEDGLRLLSTMDLSKLGLMPNIKFPTMGGHGFSMKIKS